MAIYEQLRDLERQRLSRLGLIADGPGPRCDYHQVLLEESGSCRICLQNAISFDADVEAEYDLAEGRE